MKKIKGTQPKFKVGDKVVMSKKTWYNEKEGVILEGPIRIFKDVFGTLCTSENEIKSICLPYEFDGETLTVHYPQRDMGSFIQKEFTQVSKFSHYSYFVKSSKMNTGYPERMLKLK